MSKESEKKLLEEFDDINDNPELDLPYTIGYWDPPEEEDIYKWRAIFIGPEGTPYDGGLFEAQILFKKEYPYYPSSPPKIYFKTKIFNCNISFHTGEVCISIINNWEIEDKNDKDYIEPEKKNIKEVLFAVSILFYEQNPESPLNSNAAELYEKEDKTEFNQMVKKYIDLYATEEKFQDEKLQDNF